MYFFFFPLGPLISPSELDRLCNLQSLALDFSDLTSELCALLASPRRTPLHRLSLLLNGAALEFKPLEGTATEDDWKALVNTHLSQAGGESLCFVFLAGYTNN